MRGPLWRRRLWSPRISLAKLARTVETRVSSEEQHWQRVRADGLPTRSRRWPRHRWWSALAAIVMLVVAVCLVVQVLDPLYQLLFPAEGRRWLSERLPTLWTPCAGERRAPCTTLTRFFQPLVAAALGLALFYVLNKRRVHRWYNQRAQASATALVATADPSVDRVVGRDELCEVLIERIRDPQVRCPVVLVGGVGTGKTAIVVELTRQLARRGIVPVPVRMRDARLAAELAFEELARQRFQELVDAKLFSDGSGMRIWRHLRMSNRIAVLADGLHEPFGRDEEQSEENVLREAISQAAEARLPLIVTSRPYDPLRGMRAILVGLEPLGEGAALEHGLDGTAEVMRSSWAGIAALVKAADVTDSPFFLTVIRALHRCDRLPQLSRTETGGVVRPMDRYEARWRLLDAWRAALLDGTLKRDVSRGRDDRAATLEVLSAFACLALVRGTSHLEYQDMTRYHCAEQWAILETLHDRLGDRIRSNALDHITHAFVEGAEWSIVDVRRTEAQFLHGVVQAYLGMRYLTDPKLLDRLLGRLITSRRNPEALIALTLLSRHLAAGRSERPPLTERLPITQRQEPVARLVRHLREKANSEQDLCWRFELYATAVEIDTSARRPVHADLVREIEERWEGTGAGYVPNRPANQARLQLVRRIGDAARLIVDRSRTPRPERGGRADDVDLEPDYAAFFRLASREGSYRVRLAAAREIGLGGRTAVRCLREVGGVGPREMGRSATADRRAEHLAYWEQQLRGWILPLLYQSAHQDTDETPLGPTTEITQVGGDLREWLRALEAYHPARPESHVPITSEIALAQGFRLAANIRRPLVGRTPSHRSFLVEKAERALAHSRFWYSQLVLLQALTLFSLPFDPAEPLPRREPGANPYGLVRHWLRIAGQAVRGRTPGRTHPFLTEAGRLCVRALLSRRPERYCWVDERETSSRVGSSSKVAEVRREQSLWIPDSSGWSVLTPHAQRLLADVMLLLNLADRGDLLIDREDRLTRADRADLPPCLTNDRRPLRPDRTLATSESCSPGATCLDDCPFRLCPLPAEGEPQPHELDQNFCARQADLTSPWYLLSARAPWQNVSRSQLRQFWRHMSQRQLPEWRR
ncbi:hypothetical protein GA0074692_1468 [Micromonospora pallida]|uniref:NACHT domain-containing protein n=1 Tax=Micromonospora pallida TaxID=145854 RepID=A0A1C6S060_9ACTN|nr:hypothetical protein [Micromonospora pallida]SCL22841.1 hypothetical protein GA0074692_1468 [Micromonospora pallida]